MDRYVEKHQVQQGNILPVLVLWVKQDILAPSMANQPWPDQVHSSVYLGAFVTALCFGINHRMTP